MSERCKGGGGQLKNDRCLSIHWFPPVEGPSDEGIEGKRKVTHSHLLTAVWSSSLNHKQVSSLLFFHPPRSSSPPSASLWGSEAWETGSKHRSYDSAWPQIRGAGGGDTLCLSGEQQLGEQRMSHVRICICLLPMLAFLNMQMCQFWSSALCMGSCPNRSDFFRQKSHHLLPCCCFRAWRCGLSFNVPAGLGTAIMALLVTDSIKPLWPEMNWQPSAITTAAAVVSVIVVIMRNTGPPSASHPRRTHFYWFTLFPPLVKMCNLLWGIRIWGESVGYFNSERHIEPERTRAYFSQDNYYFSGTALKQTCISHS